MPIIDQLLESEDFQVFYEENVDIFNDMDAICEDFKTDYIVQFVMENLDYFIESDLDTTFKNIAVFTEAATEHFMNELNEMIIPELVDADSDELSESETGFNDYL